MIAPSQVLIDRLEDQLGLRSVLALRQPTEPPVPVVSDPDGLREMVWEVLVKQLGHRPSEASQMIADAFRRRPDLMSAEDLFNEIYRANAASKHA